MNKKDELKISRYEFDELVKRKEVYGDLANIPFSGTHFKQIWCSNYKDKIKINVYFELPLIKYFDSTDSGNFYGEMTEQEAVELYHNLRKVLKNRGVVLE